MTQPSNTCALSSVKHKEGIFIRPQIWEKLEDKEFETILTLKKLRAWKACKSVCYDFLGNIQGLDYEEDIETLLQAYEDMECQMSLNIHFTHSHHKFFPPNISTVSDKHGERIYQDITKIDNNYWGLLLDALTWHTGGKVYEIDQKNYLLYDECIYCIIKIIVVFSSASALYLCYVFFSVIHLFNIVGNKNIVLWIYALYKNIRIYESKKNRHDRAKPFENWNC